MNTMNRTIQIIVTFCVLLIAGCGSSPAVHYFALDTIDDVVPYDEAGSPIIAVGAFRMPEYLNRSQMVSQGSGAEIIVDDFNRWAEPLDDAIHRVLANNLDVLLDSVIVVGYPSSAVVNIDYRLIGRIDHFNSGEDGLVVLRVQWAIVDAAGDVKSPPKRAQFESQAARPGDPGSTAQAMSDVLAQFSRAVADNTGSAFFD